MLRNQCNCVISYHLSEGANPRRNGERWLAREVAATATTFIDVGANVGDWAGEFVSAMPGPGRGLLFEPSQHALARLKPRFHLSPHLEIVEAAVSDKPGEMPYFEEPDAGETSSLLSAHSNARAQQRQVPVTTLDEQAEAHGLNFVDFLKIDTEGYDLHVLRGASGLIERQQVGVIQFEYNAPWALAGSTLAEAYALLEKFGYTVLLLKSRGLYKLDYPRYGEFFAYSNFVALAPQQLKKMDYFVRGTL